MSKTTDKIVAALTGKTTGLTASELRDLTKEDGKNAIAAALFAMAKRGQVVKHKGDSPNKSRYTLNPEQIADTPRQAKKPSKKKARRAAPAPRQGTSPKLRAAVAPLERSFIPAITADQELVLVDRGAAPGVRIFSAEETQAVAQLMLSNFTA